MGTVGKETPSGGNVPAQPQIWKPHFPRGLRFTDCDSGKGTRDPTAAHLTCRETQGTEVVPECI